MTLIEKLDARRIHKNCINANFEACAHDSKKADLQKSFLSQTISRGSTQSLRECRVKFSWQCSHSGTTYFAIITILFLCPPCRNASVMKSVRIGWCCMHFHFKTVTTVIPRNRQLLIKTLRIMIRCNLRHWFSSKAQSMQSYQPSTMLGVQFGVLLYVSFRPHFSSTIPFVAVNVTFCGHNDHIML